MCFIAHDEAGVVLSVLKDHCNHCFTLVSVVFVMSPIIHTYRHLSIGVCSYSESFCKKVFAYLQDLLLTGGGGKVTCGIFVVMYPPHVGVVCLQ